MIETTNKFWEEIYHQNIKKMIGICYRYTYDSQLAEDLAHDAFVLAHQKVASFEGKGPFEAWLWRITVNVCLQNIREKSKEKYVKDFLVNEAKNMEADFEIKHEIYQGFNHEELLDVINKLPEHHKLVFNLYVIDKFTHAQIGKELGISEGNSKSHLARARKKIKQILIEKLNSEKKKRKGIFSLFGLPLKLWNIDNFYNNCFKDFEILNHKQFAFDSFAAPAVHIPVLKPIFFIKYLYPSIATVVVGVSLVVYLTIKKDKPNSENKISIATKKEIIIDKKNNIPVDSTATNLQNGIIVNENNSLTNKNDTMKNSKALAAILLAGSVITNSNGQTTLSDTAFSNSKQLVLNNRTINFGQPNSGNFQPISDNASGTFYASSITWTSANHELYFNGKVIVDIEKNKFIGTGSFNIIGKVYYLVVDGKPVKLGAKINLDESKKYNLTHISADNATVKYGDVGKLGAVEIELVE